MRRLPIKPMCTAAEASQLLELLRTAYQGLGPAERQGVKGFLSGLAKCQSDLPYRNEGMSEISSNSTAMPNLRAVAKRDRTEGLRDDVNYSIGRLDWMS